jgi:hypothetical protein
MWPEWGSDKKRKKRITPSKKQKRRPPPPAPKVVKSTWKPKRSSPNDNLIWGRDEPAIMVPHKEACPV